MNSKEEKSEVEKKNSKVDLLRKSYAKVSESKMLSSETQVTEGLNSQYISK
jgi:hypothetical protein